MAGPAYDAGIGSVVRRLLRAAEMVYARAEAGIAFLPSACRPAIAAARVLYAEIGSEVERNGFDSVSQRAVVSASKKLSRVASVGAIALAPAVELTMPPLPEAKFLVDAVIAQPPVRVGSLESGSVPWWKFGARAIRVIELFDRLERREQFKRVNP